MESGPFQWFDHPRLWPLGLVLLALLTGALLLGRWLRIRFESGASGIDPEREFDGYIVSAMLGLLAVLLGFTFSLAISRYEERRLAVVTQANAIGTAWLRVQLLAPPHRERLGRLLQTYLTNQIELEKAGYPTTGVLSSRGDILVSRIWAETVAALGLPENRPVNFLVGNAVNNVIDQGDFRRAARSARVPTEVFVVLMTCLITIAGVLGFSIRKNSGTVTGCFALGLMTFALLLIIDIDRPGYGSIREPQEPMERLHLQIGYQSVVPNS